MIWKPLKMPSNFRKSEVSDDGRTAKFEIEALERGWGITIGNALRRVLLSSLQGASVVAVKIEGVEKEYATLPGVKEDVTDIILNLKTLRVKLLGDSDEVLRLNVSGDGAVTAANFDSNPNVKILTPDVHVATLSGNATLVMDVTLSQGRGYVPTDDPERKRVAANAPVGEIPVDANFNPVLNVAMHTPNTRVLERTDYDRLELEITTDGSIDPEDALAYAAKLLMDHLDMFVNFESDYEEVEEQASEAETNRIAQLLRMSIDEQELSVRSANCLRMANIHTIADLVRNKQSDMLNYKNFGRKSLVELQELLTSMDLSFGMDVDKYLKEQP